MAASVDDHLLKQLLHLLLSEIRTPIADLLTHLPPMQAQAEAGNYAELSAMTALTLRYSERLLSVIDMLLDAMRDGVVKLITDRLPLHRVVEQACQALAARAAAQGVIFNNRIPLDLPRAVLDERLFTQALISLLEVLLVTNVASGSIHFGADYDSALAQFQVYLHDQRAYTDSTELIQRFQAPLSALLDQSESLCIILSRVVMRAHGSDWQLRLAPEGGLVFYLALPLMAAEPSVKRLEAALLFSDRATDQFGDAHV
jgi:K+-sensing histidine kinase KdpD